MLRRRARERAATASEYLGVVLLVAAIVSAVALTGIAERVAGGISDAVCRIVNAGDDGVVCYSVAAPGGPGAPAGPSFTLESPDDAGLPVETTRWQIEGEGEFANGIAELGLTARIDELPDGTFEVTLCGNSGGGATTGAGGSLSADCNGWGLGGGLMAEAAGLAGERHCSTWTVGSYDEAVTLAVNQGMQWAVESGVLGETGGGLVDAAQEGAGTILGGLGALGEALPGVPDGVVDGANGASGVLSYDAPTPTTEYVGAYVRGTASASASLLLGRTLGITGEVEVEVGTGVRSYDDGSTGMVVSASGGGALVLGGLLPSESQLAIAEMLEDVVDTDEYGPVAESQLSGAFEIEAELIVGPDGSPRELVVNLDVQHNDTPRRARFAVDLSDTSAGGMVGEVFDLIEAGDFNGALERFQEEAAQVDYRGTDLTEYDTTLEVDCNLDVGVALIEKLTGEVNVSVVTVGR